MKRAGRKRIAALMFLAFLGLAGKECPKKPAAVVVIPPQEPYSALSLLDAASTLENLLLADGFTVQVAIADYDRNSVPDIIFTVSQEPAGEDPERIDDLLLAVTGLMGPVSDALTENYDLAVVKVGVETWTAKADDLADCNQKLAAGETEARVRECVRAKWKKRKW